MSESYCFSPTEMIHPEEGGGGDSHMKVTGMLVSSLRGVNCRFWSRYRLGLCVKKYLYEKTKRCESLASIFSAIKITKL